MFASGRYICFRAVLTAAKCEKLTPVPWITVWGIDPPEYITHASSGTGLDTPGTRCKIILSEIHCLKMLEDGM